MPAEAGRADAGYRAAMAGLWVVVGGSAKIASALVISEKTVSSHVSNLLRKTQTSSRVELALLARRVEQVEPTS